MSMEDGRPQKPSDINLSKFLRFVDPDDPETVMELELIDTGNTTPDGKKIYAVGMKTTDPGGQTLKYIRFVGTPFGEIVQPLNGIDSPYLTSVPQTIMGAFKGYLDENYGWLLPNGATFYYVVPTWYTKKLFGYIKHNSVLPGCILSIHEASYPMLPAAPGFIDPSNTTPLDATNPTLPINIETKSEYAMIEIVNNSGALVTFDYIFELGAV